MNLFKASSKALFIGLMLTGMLILPILASAEPVSSMVSRPVDVRNGGNMPAVLVQATPGAPSAPFTSYLPSISNGNPIAQIGLAAARTEDADSAESAYLPGRSIRYIASGTNQSSFPGIVRLRWTLSGPCNTTEIYNDVVTLQPGAWQHVFPTTVPNCQGIHLSTVEIINGPQTLTLSTLFVIVVPSAAIVDGRQAFDKCALPTIEQMQTWWTNSPYRVFNIYLGGISYACSTDPLNSFWVYSVAQQGWSYILTWVGPQAPCTTYHNRMSSNATTAYQQGRNEAAAAAAAAERIGFLGEKIIYYDVEAYSGASTSCRNTVAAFLRGWTVRLHELGEKAGAYGAPCTSYISDWANNTPYPDNVWIAHWKTPYQYDPNVSVYGTPCLSDSLWTAHKRLRQYSGGHSETWGGLTLTIDSNKLDGMITAFPGLETAVAESQATAAQAALTPQIRAMDLITQDAGWALVENRLLWTDGGGDWREITPAPQAPGDILAVKFLDVHTGWVMRRTQEADGWGKLSILRTDTGGVEWLEFPLDIPTGFVTVPVEAASIDFVDGQTGWLALELQSGSSFSQGRLFLTRDGGRTWEERSLPLGEPVEFLDAERGWVAGGPSGELLYRTLDGGLTWQPQTLPPPGFTPSGRTVPGLPAFENGQDGYLPVTISAASQPGIAVYATQDGGESWSLSASLGFEPGFQPAEALPFSLGADGRWRVGAPEQAGPSTSLLPAAGSLTLAPTGTVALDFSTDQHGWAITQEGICQGEKLLAQPEAPFLCAQRSRLLRTSDGGRTWSELILP